MQASQPQERIFAIGKGFKDETYVSSGTEVRVRTAVIERVKKGSLVFVFLAGGTPLLRTRHLTPSLLLASQDKVVIQVTHGGRLIDSGQLIANDDLEWFTVVGFTSTHRLPITGRTIKALLAADFEPGNELLLTVHNHFHARARQHQRNGDTNILNVRRNVRHVVAQATRH